MCVTPASNICAIKGIYSEITQGFPTIYGNHPKSFLSDSKLSSYITEALGSSHPAPGLIPGRKKYVYVRDEFY